MAELEVVACKAMRSCSTGGSIKDGVRFSHQFGRKLKEAGEEKSFSMIFQTERSKGQNGSLYLSRREPLDNFKSDLMS